MSLEIEGPTPPQSVKSKSSRPFSPAPEPSRPASSGGRGEQPSTRPVDRVRVSSESSTADATNCVSPLLDWITSSPALLDAGVKPVEGQRDQNLQFGADSRGQAELSRGEDRAVASRTTAGQNAHLLSGTVDRAGAAVNLHETSGKEAGQAADEAADAAQDFTLEAREEEQDSQQLFTEARQAEKDAANAKALGEQGENLVTRGVKAQDEGRDLQRQGEEKQAQAEQARTASTGSAAAPTASSGSPPRSATTGPPALTGATRPQGADKAAPAARPAAGSPAGPSRGQPAEKAASRPEGQSTGQSAEKSGAEGANLVEQGRALEEKGRADEQEGRDKIAQAAFEQWLPDQKKREAEASSRLADQARQQVTAQTAQEKEQRNVQQEEVGRADQTRRVQDLLRSYGSRATDQERAAEANRQVLQQASREAGKGPDEGLAGCPHATRGLRDPQAPPWADEDGKRLEAGQPRDDGQPRTRHSDTIGEAIISPASTAGADGVGSNRAGFTKQGDQINVRLNSLI